MKNIGVKLIAFSLLTYGLIGFTIPVPDLNDLEKYRLKGNVRSLMEIKYALPDENLNAAKEKIVYHKYTVFDQNGYETETILYEQSKEYLISKFRFGQDGKPLEMSEHNPDGTLNLLVTYDYDDKGNIIEANYQWGNERKIGEIGEIAENTDYYFEIIQNEIFTKVLYTNEYRGYCTEEEYYKADSSLSFKFIYKYDIHGNKLESGYYHGNGRLSWLTKYKYDRYNNLIESRLFKSNRIAVFSKYEYQFDETGNWISRKENRDVHLNILTAGLDRNDMLTERIIEYY